MNADRRLLLIAVLSAVLAVSGCSGSNESADDTNSTVLSPTTQGERSSGETDDEPTDDDPADGDPADGDPADGDPAEAEDDDQEQEQEQEEPADVSTTIVDRADGIELVFADGMLGPAKLGSTIEELTTEMGPDYEIGPAETVRTDFPVGYAVSRDGERLFWAVEQDGRIVTFMSSNPKVGLDNGLRPKLALEEAITLFGEATLSLGPEQREFARFADGIGIDESVSVLVAIGDFGGPVGQYDFADDALVPETTTYELEGANIKELWFNLPE